tara:strand:- start:1410 stop:2261 length:852 start_codon:yes stop_codon:yes gene_type:complete
MADDSRDTVSQIRDKRNEAFNKGIELLNKIKSSLPQEEQDIFPLSKDFILRAVNAVFNECAEQYGRYQTREMKADEKLFQWTKDAIEEDLGLNLTKSTTYSADYSDKRKNAAEPANGLTEMGAAVKAAVAAEQAALQAEQQAREEVTTEATEAAEKARINAEEATEARKKIINKQSIYFKLFKITHPFVNLIAIYDVYINNANNDHNFKKYNLISLMDKYKNKAERLMNEQVGLSGIIPREKLVGGRKKQLKNNRSKTYRKRKSKTYRKRKSKTYRKRKSKTY